MIKNFLLTLLFLFTLSIGVNAQHSEGILGASYGTNNTVSIDFGVNFLNSKDNGIELLGSISLPLDIKTKGKLYNNISENTFTGDFVDGGVQDLAAFLISPTYRLGKFSVGPTVGVSTASGYQNRYDSSRILSNNGSYHIYTDQKEYKFLYGGLSTYKVSNNIGILAGYNNFDKGKVGLLIFL